MDLQSTCLPVNKNLNVFRSTLMCWCKDITITFTKAKNCHNKKETHKRYYLIYNTTQRYISIRRFRIRFFVKLHETLFLNLEWTYFRQYHFSFRLGMKSVWKRFFMVSATYKCKLILFFVIHHAHFVSEHKINYE